ncbi:hypothetical protein A2U01_0005968, partial [Trifolium medium]|nr:hypothetical protein [Trifolium medium]
VTNISINVFDPDGNEHQFRSPAISGNSYCTTPLLVPWDRGKIESCSILFSVNDLFPATVFFPVRGEICGWPWVPWFRKHSVTNGGFDIFDPGGNECWYRSPATIDGDNRHTLSLLWLPCDRGKFTVWNGVRLVIWALFVWISIEEPLSSIWFDFVIGLGPATYSNFSWSNF